MKIDKTAIRTLADLLEEKGLGEIEVREGDSTVRVTRANCSLPGTVPPSVALTPLIPATGPTPNPIGAVFSPIVGTAYLQPEPGAPAFIRKGDSVAIGNTLLIIEAMKVMNPIRAEIAGTVVEIRVTDGQPVEYGDILVVIE